MDVTESFRNGPKNVFRDGNKRRAPRSVAEKEGEGCSSSRTIYLRGTKAKKTDKEKMIYKKKGGATTLTWGNLKRDTRKKRKAPSQIIREPVGYICGERVALENGFYGAYRRNVLKNGVHKAGTDFRAVRNQPSPERGGGEETRVPNGCKSKCNTIPLR